MAKNLNNTNTTTSLEATRKLLEMSRNERLIYVRDTILSVNKTTDELYIRKEKLAQFLFDNDVIQHQLSKTELKKIKRQELVDILDTAVQNLMKAGIITPVNTVSVGDLDISNDIEPEEIEEETFTPLEYTNNISMNILKGVIEQANTNNAHNFISDWMLTSVIAELVTRHPLKGKDADGKWTEFYKSFTEAQKENIKILRVEFLKRSGFTPIKGKDGKATGYVIPAKSLIYGRHKWLGAACVYHFVAKGNTKPVVYHVSLNGIKNVATGNITPLDDSAYAKLDSACKFIQ